MYSSIIRVFETIDQNKEARSLRLQSYKNTSRDTNKNNCSDNNINYFLGETANILVQQQEEPREHNQSIHLENISFAYGSRPDVLVLEDLSMVLPSHNITCIIGKSGCGKSTLVSLLSGLLYPTKGSIKLGEKVVTSIVETTSLSPSAIDRIEIPWLLDAAVGVVQQSDHSLFSGTIAENIEYGKVRSI